MTPQDTWQAVLPVFWDCGAAECEGLGGGGERVCSEARVAGSAGPDQTRDTDPIIGLGGDGDSIHSKASPWPLPSPATRPGTWGQCAGSVAHDLLTSEEAASMRITARLPAAW